MERRDGPSDRRRHKVHHVTEIPDRRAHPVKYRLIQARWRIALWTTVYPVQMALAVALVVCAIPVYLLLVAQSDLRKSQAELQSAVGKIQDSRVAATKDICGQLDRNARTSNAQLKLFQGIIVDGARQGQIFDKLYKEFGAPPYRTRLKQAEATAKAIEHLKLPLPNCTKAVYGIRRDIHPPSPPSHYGGPH